MLLFNVTRSKFRVLFFSCTVVDGLANNNCFLISVRLEILICDFVILELNHAVVCRQRHCWCKGVIVSCFARQSNRNKSTNQSSNA